ncbi:Uncharacterised protein [Burkholderia pseudomallei]|uniref:Uncharacterized protein n=1 Tax=Burkholderia pseudomallei 1710a TaxID=320371 RepID=A0A0E1VZP7_BURPE|nr:hypothetical protein [Burkholderia pseudomallei]AIS47126.1 hypothetical protein DR61_1366 [Burkholderia pseudomallei]EET06425.1 hypothetical protein BURPS1710A_1908 [Burkholderia pseudomallei 1710a]MCQ8222609.1 hypothetical protein [Burkholderia pseudomallei]MCW0098387.1 hypothetical protein [Burkholderia pseudomallei]CAJ2780720.1 Uncharacterised protein [Burkholderia pseudomallei]
MRPFTVSVVIDASYPICSIVSPRRPAFRFKQSQISQFPVLKLTAFFIRPPES